MTPAAGASTDTGHASSSSASARAATSTSPTRRCARIDRIEHRFLRTSHRTRAPTSSPTPPRFDHLYESADTFDDVYTEIADALVAARRRARRDPLRRAGLAARPRTHRPSPRATRRRRPRRPAGDVVPRRRLGAARHRPGRGRRPPRRRPRVRHGRRRRTRAAARRPHPRRLGAVGDQAGRRGCDGRRDASSSCRRSAPPTSGSCDTTWAELDRTVDGRPPDVAVDPRARRTGRRRVRPLPPAHPPAARAVPVGHRADAPDAWSPTCSRRPTRWSTRSTASTPTTRPPTRT